MAVISNGRLVIQQCLKATLPVKTGVDDNWETVGIGRGMIVFVCFFKNASETCLGKLISTVFGIKLSENDEGKLVSLLNLPGDLLIIPQASLGGKLRGKSFQYHNNVNKDTGLQLYSDFVQKCTNFVKDSEKEITIKSGTYGEKQRLSVVTNGPNTHIIEF